MHTTCSANLESFGHELPLPQSRVRETARVANYLVPRGLCVKRSSQRVSAATPIITPRLILELAERGGARCARNEPHTVRLVSHQRAKLGSGRGAGGAG